MPEELGELGRGVVADAVQLYEVRFLSGGELGLFALQPATGLGDGQPLAGAHADEIGSNSATMARTLKMSRPTGSAIGGVASGSGLTTESQ
jgi:hypothetical protein